MLFPLCAELCAPLCLSSLEDVPSALGARAFAKTMRSAPFPILRLVRSFWHIQDLKYPAIGNFGTFLRKLQEPHIWLNLAQISSYGGIGSGRTNARTHTSEHKKRCRACGHGREITLIIRPEPPLLQFGVNKSTIGTHDINN